MLTEKNDMKLTRTQAEVVLGMADNNLNVAATARKMYMHRNNIDYHIKMIRLRTGKNPMKFYDLCELLPVAKEAMEQGILEVDV